MRYSSRARGWPAFNSPRCTECVEIGHRVADTMMASAALLQPFHLLTSVRPAQQVFDYNSSSIVLTRFSMLMARERSTQISESETATRRQTQEGTTSMRSGHSHSLSLEDLHLVRRENIIERRNLPDENHFRFCFFQFSRFSVPRYRFLF